MDSSFLNSLKCKNSNPYSQKLTPTKIFYFLDFNPTKIQFLNSDIIVHWNSNSQILKKKNKKNRRKKFTLESYLRKQLRYLSKQLLTNWISFKQLVTNWSKDFAINFVFIVSFPYQFRVYTHELFSIVVFVCTNGMDEISEPLLKESIFWA